MSLIPALVQELLKIFFGGVGGGLKGPPGGIGLKHLFAHNKLAISSLDSLMQSSRNW